MHGHGDRVYPGSALNLPTHRHYWGVDFVYVDQQHRILIRDLIQEIPAEEDSISSVRFVYLVLWLFLDVEAHREHENKSIAAVMITLVITSKSVQPVIYYPW